MSLPSEEEIKERIEIIRSDLVEIVMESWKQWLKLGQPEWTARGRANSVWELMRVEAYKRFKDNKAVVIIDEPLTVSYLVNDFLLFRFKKGAESGLTANFPTQLALDYHDPDKNLLGLSEVCRLEVVYVLNKPLEARIQDVLVIARNGDSIACCFSLLDDASGVASLPAGTDNGLDNGSKRAVVTPKRRAAEDRGKGSD